MAEDNAVLMARWINDNADKRGTPEFDQVAAGLKAEMAKRQTQTTVGQPTSARNAVRAQMDLPPEVGSPYSDKYDPTQSTLGYIGNEVAKRAAGILSIPQAGGEAMARNIPFIGPLTMLARQATGIKGMPSIGDLAQRSGIVDPAMKAPSPEVQALTGMGLEVAQNFTFPGTTAQRVLGGVGSYIGGQAGKDVGGTAGEVLGSVAGGVLAPAMLLNRLQTVSDVYRWVKDSTGSNVEETLARNPELVARARQTIMDDLASTMRSNPAAYKAKYEQALELERSLPGLKLSIGQKFGVPSILSKEQQMARTSDAALNEAGSVAQGNQRVLQTPLQAPPGARYQAQRIVDRLVQEADSAANMASRNASDLTDEAGRAASALNRPADVEALGERALAIRANEKTASRGTAGQLMQKAGQAAESEAAQFDASPVIAKAREMFKQPVWDDANVTEVANKLNQLGLKSAGENLTGRSIPPDLMPYATGQNAVDVTRLPFADLADLRSAINKDIGAAMRSKSENAATQLRNLYQLKDQVDNVIAASPFEATKKAYGDFIDFYKQDFVPRFRTGVNFTAEKMKAGGEPALPGEKVFSEYFKAGSPTNAARYLRLYEKNPEAMQLMHDAILDRYSKEVIKNGEIVPTAHDAFMRKYGAALDVMERRGFTFGNELRDSATAYKAATDASAAMLEKADALATSKAMTVLTDKFGARSVDAIAEDVLKDPRRMRAVLDTMDATQAKGVANLIKEHIAGPILKDGSVGSKELGNLLASPDRMRSYQMIMSKAYGTEAAAKHMETLRNIQKAAERVEMLPPPSSTTDSVAAYGMKKDALQRATGVSMPTVFNMLRGVVSGRISPEWATAALGSQAGLTIAKGMENAVYQKILSDPETAKQLLLLMEQKAATPASLNLARKVAEKIPAVARYFFGTRQYGSLAPMAAGNIAVNSTQPQPEEAR